MKFGKKLLAVVLAGVLALAMLTACGGSGTSPMSADKIADTINGVRVNEYQKTGLRRCTEAEELYQSVAVAEAEYAADQTDENRQKVSEVYRQTIVKLADIQIDGKTIDLDKTWISVSYDLNNSNLGNLTNALKDTRTNWNKYLVNDEQVTHMAVAYAEKDGHSGVVMIAIVLEDAE